MINWPIDEMKDECCNSTFVDVTEQIKQLLEENDIPYEIREIPKRKYRKIHCTDSLSKYNEDTPHVDEDKLLEFIQKWDTFVFEKAFWSGGCYGFGSMHPRTGIMIKYKG